MSHGSTCSADISLVSMEQASCILSTEYAKDTLITLPRLRLMAAKEEDSQYDKTVHMEKQFDLHLRKRGSALTGSS